MQFGRVLYPTQSSRESPASEAAQTVLSIVIPALSYGASIGIFWIERLSFPLHPSWPTQFTVAVTIAAFAAAFCATHRRGLAFLYPLQCGLVLFSGYPLGDSMHVHVPFLFALHTQAVLLFSRRLGMTVAGITIGAVALGRTGTSAWGIPLQPPSVGNSFSFVAIGILILLVLAYLRRSLDQLTEERLRTSKLRDTVDELMKANVAFQDFTKRVEDESALEERRRLSRDIHDTVGHSLVSLIMTMEAAMQIAGQQTPGLYRVLKGARDQAQESLNETRRAVRSIRGPQSVGLRGLRAIHHLVTTFERATRVSVRTDFANMPPQFGSELDTLLYRCVQETLTNAFRHGGATLVEFRFSLLSDTVHLNVKDNGRGTKGTITEGVGFAGIRERLAQHGGTVNASNIAGGFEVQIVIPVGQEGDS